MHIHTINHADRHTHTRTQKSRRGPRNSPPNMAAGTDIDGAALQKVFSKLVEGLKAVNIIDELHEKNILTREEYDGIFDACSKASSKEDSRNVNRRVLIAIRSRPPGFAPMLVEILKKKYSSLAAALEEGEQRCNASSACSVMCMKEVTLTPTVINWNVTLTPTVINWNVTRYCSFVPQPSLR